MSAETRYHVAALQHAEHGVEPDPATFVGVKAHWYVTNTGGVALNGVLAAITKRRSFQLLFWGAVAVHVAEAGYAYRAAQRAGFTESAPRWALQTLAVGFPSLLALRKARA
jgi:hypothetical protein